MFRVFVAMSTSPPSFFFFNDTATTEIYTLSLHDALPISGQRLGLPLLNHLERVGTRMIQSQVLPMPLFTNPRDRKSTRLNSSHANISYAVFCLKKKNNVYLLLHLKNHHLYYSHVYMLHIV